MAATDIRGTVDIDGPIGPFQVGFHATHITVRLPRLGSVWRCLTHWHRILDALAPILGLPLATAASTPPAVILVRDRPIARVALRTGRPRLVPTPLAFWRRTDPAQVSTRG